MFKVDSKDIKTTSKNEHLLPLDMYTYVCSGVFVVNFEHISHLFFSVSIVDFEQVNVFWEPSLWATWTHPHFHFDFLILLCRFAHIQFTFMVNFYLLCCGG